MKNNKPIAVINLSNSVEKILNNITDAISDEEDLCNENFILNDLTIYDLERTLVSKTFNIQVIEDDSKINYTLLGIYGY
jgi:hypothetical protein